jgi:site-specific DNA-methyltransferase (adenine-specific)
MFKNIIGTHKPDILDCISNLSSDEVFTPPSVVNQVLDLFPAEIWNNSQLKFLDPACKSGVFLREIAKRLMVGLEGEIQDDQIRREHIFKNMLFGISITELTGLLARRSLYYSKSANSKYSVIKFENEHGNVQYSRGTHIYVNGKCKFCGVSEDQLDRGSELENHAYQFIHTEKVFPMKFDVIIGNPPYQLDTGGSGRQAKPIYQHFISQAKSLDPRFISMIVPARWYSGGFGLDDFRREMLNDKRIKCLVDFENSAEVFPGVDIAGGVCFFLWDKNHNGKCEVSSNYEGKSIKVLRDLSEFDIFIRQPISIPIIQKVLGKGKGKFLDSVVSSIRPFGMPTNYVPKDKGVPCHFVQKIGLKYASSEDVTDNYGYLDKWKILIPKAPIAGQTDFSRPIRFYHEKNAIVAKPGECCTESWIVASAFNSQEEALSFRSYLFTKIVRFLILQTVISQDVNRKNFKFVPDFEMYNQTFTDEYLKEKFSITEDEWKYIDSRILPI